MFEMLTNADGDRCAELAGRLRRTIAEMGDIEAPIVVIALLGVLTQRLADIRIGRTELDDLTSRLLPAMVEVWRRARVIISPTGPRN